MADDVRPLYNDPDNVKARDLTIEGLVTFQVGDESVEFETVSFTTYVEDPEDFDIMLASLKALIPSDFRTWNPGLKRWKIVGLLPEYERYLCQIFPNFNGAITAARGQQFFPGWERRL